MLINTIRNAACFCFISVNRTSYSMRKLLDIVTKAVFEDDLTEIKLKKEAEEIVRYPFLYDRKDIKIENNLQTLATTLQYVGTLSRRRHSHIVDSSTYHTILKQYYETLKLTLKDHLNWHIEPSYQLSYLLPSFIHTDNEQILSLVKLKQLEVFELMCRSREISIYEFMRIFSKDVYNVTDLPLLDSLLHEHFYPRIGQIETINQLEQVLEYLGRLESINALTLCIAIKLLKEEMESEIAKPHISLDWYISFTGCISAIKFRDIKDITEQSPNELQQILAKLTERTFKIDGETFKVASLGNQQNIQKIITHMQPTILKKIEKYKEEMDKLQAQQSQAVPTLIEKEKIEQRQFLRNINKQAIKQSLMFELMPKLTKSLLAISCLKPCPSEHLQTFLKSPLFLNFINQYPCYPNLFKDLIQTLEFLKAEYNISMNPSELDSKIQVFRGKLNKFLNHIIKESSDSQILENFTHPRPKVEDQSLWNLEGPALLTRLMTADQGFSFSNVLSMLKEDSTFLQSRMKLSHKQFIKTLFNRSIKTFKIQIDYWNYPHCYTFANVDNNIYGYVQHRFNQNTRVPKNCTVYTLAELEQIESKIGVFQSKQ